MTLDNVNIQKIDSIKILVREIPEIISHWSLFSKKPHWITWTLIVLNKFVFYPNNCLALLWILSYWELAVAATISLLATYIWNFIFFLLACNIDFILKSTHSVDCQDFKHKTISKTFAQLSKNLLYFCPPWSSF